MTRTLSIPKDLEEFFGLETYFDGRERSSCDADGLKSTHESLRSGNRTCRTKSVEDVHQSSNSMSADPTPVLTSEAIKLYCCCRNIRGFLAMKGPDPYRVLSGGVG